MPANRIHRIVPYPNILLDSNTESKRFALLGAKYVTIVTLDVSDNEATCHIEKAYGPFKDWIMDAQWMLDGPKSTWTLSIIYAHNFLEIVQLNRSGLIDVVHSVQCEVRCILYSARISGFTRESLQVASESWLAMKASFSVYGLIRMQIKL
ncbi:hypothetical protein BY458DRAFT_218813 [Sporodiniella umbellata]|nr:hypothetical protein BY458DRAFT_218813 [Sporodiniella umbellata]